MEAQNANDIDRLMESLKTVVVAAGGSMIDLVVSSDGQRKVLARFPLPEKPDAIFSGEIYEGQLIFGLDNFDKVGIRYSMVRDMFDEDDMDFLGRNLLWLFKNETPKSDEYLQACAVKDDQIKRWMSGDFSDSSFT
jgi:hypothetical protein